MSEASMFKGIPNTAEMRQNLKTLKKYLTPGWDFRLHGRSPIQKSTNTFSVNLSNAKMITLYPVREGYTWISHDEYAKLCDDSHRLDEAHHQITELNKMFSDMRVSSSRTTALLEGKSAEYRAIRNRWLYCEWYILIWRGIKRLFGREIED